MNMALNSWFSFLHFQTLGLQMWVTMFGLILVSLNESDHVWYLHSLEESVFTSQLQYLEHITACRVHFPPPGSSLANSKCRDAMAGLIQALPPMHLPS